MQKEPWRIEMFGGLRACCGERVVTRFPTYKTGILLAYLALYSNREHTRRELIELLWPETDSTAASASLRQALASLRRELQSDDDSPPPLLLTDRETVALVSGAFTTDVAEFEAALQRGDLSGAVER